jgi:hypothetical protein
MTIKLKRDPTTLPADTVKPKPTFLSSSDQYAVTTAPAVPKESTQQLASGEWTVRDVNGRVQNVAVRFEVGIPRISA